MKYLISFIFLFAFARGLAQQSISKPALLNARETMLTSTYSTQVISAQVENWQREKVLSPRSAATWFNYYLWAERDKQIPQKEKSKLLAATVADAKQYISQTAEYSLMLYLQSGKKDSASLLKALSLASNKSGIYPYVIQYYIIQEDEHALTEYCKKWNNVDPLSGNLYAYHYNVLMSADSNAVIYGRGLYDIVPMAVLQYVYNIRKDIQLRYYRGIPEIQSNSYLCLSLGREILSQYQYAAYTGLLVKMKGTTGIDELKKHIEKNMDLRFLEVGGYWETDLSRLFKNYLPSFILLYKHYKQMDEAEAGRILLFIQKIAVSAHIEKEVTQLLEK
jgi:hypothetical protein